MIQIKKVVKQDDRHPINCKFKPEDYARFDKAWSEAAIDLCRYKQQLSAREVVLFLVEHYLAEKERDE